MQFSFEQLLESCPAIAELRKDAISIAQHERRPWYENWLEDSSIFARAIAAAAVQLHVPQDRIRDMALTGCLDTYFHEKRRKAKKR